MRSDLIIAGAVWYWLSEHAPHLVENWDFQPDDELKAFVTRILSTFGFIGAQFTGQSAIAATAIQQWNLRDIALLGGGYPTPLTPTPDQILYYTDINPQVSAEVAQLGYNTCKVDVTQVDDLKQLKGASTAIATGLFHFLSDAAMQQVMRNFAEAGLRTVVINHINPGVPDALIQNWTRMGFTVYKRRPDEVTALMPEDWQIEAAQTARDLLIHHPALGQKFAQLEELSDIYLVRRS
jgi:hypothetical protein